MYRLIENFKLYKNLWLLFKNKFFHKNNKYKNRTPEATKNAHFWYLSIDGAFTVLLYETIIFMHPNYKKQVITLYILVKCPLEKKAHDSATKIVVDQIEHDGNNINKKKYSSLILKKFISLVNHSIV